MNELDQRLKENMERMQQRQEDLYRNRIDSRAKLRDEFAKAALQGDWAAQNEYAGSFHPGMPEASFIERAGMYYKMADAMMVAREKTE